MQSPANRDSWDNPDGTPASAGEVVYYGIRGEGISFESWREHRENAAYCTVATTTFDRLEVRTAWTGRVVDDGRGDDVEDSCAKAEARRAGAERAAGEAGKAGSTTWDVDNRSSEATTGALLAKMWGDAKGWYAQTAFEYGDFYAHPEEMYLRQRIDDLSAEETRQFVNAFPERTAQLFQLQIDPSPARRAIAAEPDSWPLSEGA